MKNTSKRFSNAGPGQLRKGSYWTKLLRDVIGNYQLYLLVLPAIIWYIIFRYVPLYGVQISFRNYKPGMEITSAPFVGFKWFNMFFKSYYFWPMIFNTLRITVYSHLFSLPIAVFMALMFNEMKHVRYRKLVQTVTYSPNFISTVVLVGMLYVFFNPDYGPFVIAGEKIGLDLGRTLTSPRAFYHLYVWSGIWQKTGFNTVIYYSALAGIDPSLYEVASIDGASRFQKMRHVSVPLIMPTIIICLVMSCGSMLSVGFEKIYLMQNNLNIESARVISTFVYEKGLLGGQFSYTTAIGLFNNIVNFIILLVINEISKKTTEVSMF